MKPAPQKETARELRKEMKVKKKDHKIEIRKFLVIRSYCVEPGCKYHGDFAVQGHCFSKLPDAHSKYIEHVLKHGTEMLKELKSLRKVNKWQTDKAWIRMLESRVITDWASKWFDLDHLVYLRAEVARLKKKCGEPLECKPK